GGRSTAATSRRPCSRRTRRPAAATEAGWTDAQAPEGSGAFSGFPHRSSTRVLFSQSKKLASRGGPDYDAPIGNAFCAAGFGGGWRRSSWEQAATDGSTAATSE